jgi:HK97 family phage portal protein
LSFWGWLAGSSAGERANANPASSVGPPGYVPGDPDGVLYDPPPPVVDTRFASVSASPWSGWPAEWATPEFGGRAAPLVDTAWDCLDLNSSILSTMPTYLRRGGVVLDPVGWMQNPDDTVYESWAEFAKSLFWNYQLGEAFIWVVARNAQGYPLRFREIPPYLMRVEMVGASRRRYWLGSVELVPEDLLHIRYKSDPFCARGQGPLDVAAPRVVTAGLLTRLVGTIAEQGGVPSYWLETDKTLTAKQADDMLNEWVDSRVRNNGRPALLVQGTKASTLPVSVKDMALLELGQWTEARICIKLRVPPFLMGLPGGGDSMTYSNVSSLFDYHDRSGLRPIAKTVMAALSNWALPRGQCVELDSEEYTRPGMVERSQAYANWNQIPGAVSGADVRELEDLEGDPPTMPAASVDANVTPMLPRIPQVVQQGGTGA